VSLSLDELREALGPAGRTMPDDRLEELRLDSAALARVLLDVLGERGEQEREAA